MYSVSGLWGLGWILAGYIILTDTKTVFGMGNGIGVYELSS
jgi:hypothetical protein